MKTRQFLSAHPTPPLARLERELLVVRDRVLERHWPAAKVQPAEPDAATARLLRCDSCGRAEPRTADELRQLARFGWPECCGKTMTLTAEAPAVPIRRERRAGHRRSARVGVRVEVRRGCLGMGPDLGLGLLDVSGDGMRVRLRAPVRVGEEAEVTVWPPEGGPRVRVRGRVVWCRPAAGLAFLAGLRLRRRLTVEEEAGLVR